jgi:hypothetical protein
MVFLLLCLAAVWDPSLSPMKGPDREIAPKHSFKAHDGAVTVGWFLPYTADVPSLRNRMHVRTQEAVDARRQVVPPLCSHISPGNELTSRS